MLSPKIVAATWLMTVFTAGSSTGTMPNASATKVMPTNRTPSRMAIAVSVAAALRGSGGLNAGTPLAIASVPVRATEPRRRRADEQQDA